MTDRLETRALQLGAFSRRSTGKDWMPPRPSFDVPERITNASASGTYSGKHDLSYRGMHVRLPSWGII